MLAQRAEKSVRRAQARTKAAAPGLPIAAPLVLLVLFHLEPLVAPKSDDGG